ncbi:MAG: hypothetical protein KHX21_06795 [Clostridium sp.]|nr:hypothetical protein [Clostridium sp.]
MKQDEARIERIYALFDEYRQAYAAEWQREPRPVTPVLQSTIENIRADLMDQMPEAIITADDPANERAAQALTEILGENHRRCHYENEYAKLLHDLLIGGYMVQETGFDPHADGGLGGAFLRHADAHNVMIDPMCADIQDSRAVFKFAPYPKEWFKSRYPDDYDKLKPDANTIMPQSDAHLGRGNDERILMLECWEREYDKQTGRFRVHMARLAGRRMLEDSRIVKPDGYYAHGEYPFVITALFPRKGTALGYGYVDMFATQQLYADKIDQIVLKNALMASHNKLLITGASGFDPADMADWSKEVHQGDSLSGITWFPTAPLPAYITQYAEAIRQSIKEESGSNDFSRGTTYGGVTAASAIAALQEASGKRSRMTARLIHGAFEQAVRQELEVEREYCAFSRTVRLKGKKETMAFTYKDMYALSPLNNALPIEFMITVKAQRENRFTVAAHNETILSLVKLNMLAPDAALELMLFDGKEQALSLMKERNEALSEAAY